MAGPSIVKIGSQYVMAYSRERYSAKGPQVDSQRARDRHRRNGGQRRWQDLPERHRPAQHWFPARRIFVVPPEGAFSPSLYLDGNVLRGWVSV